MHPAEIRKKRDKTPDEALAALMRLCARAEKSEGDARRLMRGWGVAEKDAEQVLGRLVRDRFIDDSRYAEACAKNCGSAAGASTKSARRSNARGFRRNGSTRRCRRPTVRQWASGSRSSSNARPGR